MGKFQDKRKEFQKKLKDFRKRHQVTSRILAASMKMGVPMFVSACGMYIQLVLEHYGTYRFVQEYFLTDEDGKSAFTMYDPGSNAIPGDIPKAIEADVTKAMDTLAFFPAGIFFLITVLVLKWSYRSVKRSQSGTSRWALQKLFRQAVFGIWTKVCLMWAMLATLKGIFDAVTLQPDSIGWEKCKERLTPEFVKYFRHNHSFFPDMFILDFETLLGAYPGHKPPVRLCSDMMYSGHTFTVLVFCLGINELLYMAIDEYNATWKTTNARTYKIVLSVGVLLYVLCHQGLEIYVVLKTHFHYSSDVIAALFFSLLMWTNAIVPYGAKLWATRRFRGLVPMLFTFDDEDSKKDTVDDDEDDPRNQSLLDDGERSKSLQQEERAWSKEERNFIPAGEILIPFTNVQQHVYTDRQFTTMLTGKKYLIAKEIIRERLKLPKDDIFAPNKRQHEEMEKLQETIVRYCQQNMSMNDGVYIKDYCLEKPLDQDDWFHETDNTRLKERICAPKEDKQRVISMWCVQGVLPLLIGAIVFTFVRFSWGWATYTYVHQYIIDEANVPRVRLHDPFQAWLRHNGADDPDPNRETDHYNQYWFTVAVAMIAACMLLLLSKKSTRPCALQVWHKAGISVYTCAIITSILVLVTAVPDSAGRNRCKYVLQQSASWEFMSTNHSLSEILQASLTENSGVHCGISYGGWFQFVLIIYLALFEIALMVLRKAFMKELEKKFRYVKFFVLALLGAIFSCLLWIEWRRFEKNRLHYTMDLVMHTSLAFLIYTNSVVTIAAKWWSRCFLKLDEREMDFDDKLNSDGDILIPPCCLPFCCLWGRYHLYSDEKVKKLHTILFTGEKQMSERMMARLGVFTKQETPKQETPMQETPKQ